MSATTFQALVHYGTPHIRSVIRAVADKDLDAALRKVRGRPRAIKSLPVAMVVRVIDLVEDVDLYNEILACNDRRTGVHNALRSHRLVERARLRRAVVPAELDNVDPHSPTIVAELRHYLACRSNPRLGVVAWWRSLEGSDRTAAVRAVHTATDDDLDVLSYLAFDVARGDVPEVSEGDVTPLSAKWRLDFGAIIAREAAKSIDVIDVPTARVLARLVGRGTPLRTAEPPSEEVVRILADNRALLVHLVSACLIGDELLIEKATDLNPRELVSVLQACRSRVVVEALTARLATATEHLSGAAEVIELVPGLSSDARITLLRHGSAREVVQFLRGVEVNPIRPGEASRLVEDIIAGRSHVTIENLIYHISRLGDRPFGAGMCEAVEALIVSAPAGDLLRHRCALGSQAMHHLCARLGEDRQAWEHAVALLSGWDGTLDQLAAAASRL